MKDLQKDILHFWFEETKPAQWFQKNSDFDKKIKDRFSQTYDLAKDGVMDDWRNDTDGSLALVLVLDQFPRNMFRDTPQAFAADHKALIVSKYAISKGFDQLLNPVKRRFLYLPFEHSENLSDQRRSVELFEAMKEDDPLGHEYALRHYDVIEKFGRFPHRNKILGRENTSEEEDYLKQPGSGF